jgi:hypothetical protein
MLAWSGNTARKKEKLINPGKKLKTADAIQN